MIHMNSRFSLFIFVYFAFQWLSSVTAVPVGEIESEKDSIFRRLGYVDDWFNALLNYHQPKTQSATGYNTIDSTQLEGLSLDTAIRLLCLEQALQEVVTDFKKPTAVLDDNDYQRLKEIFSQSKYALNALQLPTHLASFAEVDPRYPGFFQNAFSDIRQSLSNFNDALATKARPEGPRSSQVPPDFHTTQSDLSDMIKTCSTYEYEMNRFIQDKGRSNQKITEQDPNDCYLPSTLPGVKQISTADLLREYKLLSTVAPQRLGDYLYRLAQLDPSVEEAAKNKPYSEPGHVLSGRPNLPVSGGATYPPGKYQSKGLQADACSLSNSPRVQDIIRATIAAL